MMRFKFLVAAGAVLGFWVGCGGGDFPTAPTSGTVVCEGKPVPHVMVFFEPLQQKDSQSAIVGRSAFAIADAEGKFVLSSYGKNDGAVLGKHRVRVGLPHREDHPNFKCDCYLNSEVDLIPEIEVKKGKNEFELVLKKKTGREQPVKKDD
jgi:hypothetical protein